MKFIVEECCITNFIGIIIDDLDEQRAMRSRHIQNLPDVIRAVKDIYYHSDRPLFAHARDGRGKRRATDALPFRPRVDTLLENIGTIIHNYFNGTPNVDNNQANFDEFHEFLCDTFLTGINPIRESAGIADLSYGQAQKLINLTFKYLTTYADYLEYADLFSYCHMVIDSEVLGQLTKPGIGRILGIRPASGLSGSFKGKGWTAFDKDDYLNLVREYRRVIDPYMGDNTYMNFEYHAWRNRCCTLNHVGTYATTITRFHR